MTKVANILVPTDLSPHSDAALALAADFAIAFESKIHLLLVFQSEPAPFSDGEIHIPNDFWGTNRSGAQEILNDLAKKMANDFQCDVTTHLEDGDPHLVIRRLAEMLPADWIIMGSRGRRGLGHVLLGSVAERTIRLAPCPVLVTKSPEADRAFEEKSPEDCHDDLGDEARHVARSLREFLFRRDQSLRQRVWRWFFAASFEIQQRQPIRRNSRQTSDLPVASIAAVTRATSC